MEDDGTVNMMKPATVVAPVSATSDTGHDQNCGDGDDDALVDLNFQMASGANYSSLRNLLPSKRLTWTKLDFKGASVADDRRMKRTEGVDTPAAGGDVGGAGIGISNRKSVGLKGLMPVRPTWTKLDFHGASIEDERRTKRNSRQSGTKFNEGQYSNLKTFLPARTITFRKGQIFSSGSATIVNSNVMRTQRLESQGGVKNENDAVDLLSQQQQQHRDEVYGVIDKGADSTCDSTQGKSFTNLKDLLPERKISWRTIK